MNTASIIQHSASALAATSLLLPGATIGSASARQDPGEVRVTAIGTSPDRCDLARAGNQFVRCDYLTGNGVAAPAWIPRVGSAATQHVAPIDASVASRPAPSRKARLLTTSGSAAGGFAWSTDEQFETTVDCDTFDAHVAATVTDRFTVSLDSNGAISGFTESLWAPRIVWRNMQTGASIVVAGRFTQNVSRIPGTHNFHRTVTGSRTVVGDEGGAARRTAARRVVGGGATPWADLAGQHAFADAMLAEPTLCSAIS